MATTTRTTNEKTTSTTDVPDVAQKLREQLLSGVSAGQQLSVDALRTWTRGVSALARPDATDGVGARAAEGVTSATEFAYDVAADLLGAQREFALGVTRTLAGRSNG